MEPFYGKRFYIERCLSPLCDGFSECGGFSSAKRVAVLCRAFGITYAPHNTSKGIGLAAAIQLAACTPEYEYYLEYST